MAKFNVTIKSIQTWMYVYEEVEADTPAQAMDKALKRFEEGNDSDDNYVDSDMTSIELVERTDVFKG
jgi:hypothetical protein